MIEVENLSKLYKLGNIGTGTLSHDLNRWWHRIRGKEDPYMKAGERNDRTARSNSGVVWSLRDLNFSIGQGEVFGVVGRNGAGKSTLLKLLSKITKPTTGSIRLNGRASSLLEVGTGFHPELTGRENIFLNGAILGMTRAEIRRKFDAIVEFSGVEKYIDTPVKRYSSGMYVRLAFAVAAHLEPEILIIDEVLAVGDAEFQEKCLGKMKDVSSKEGRTVLFVSHNIAAIKTLCNRALLLEQGTQKAVGDVEEILSLYQAGEEDREAGRRGRLPMQQPAYFIGWKLDTAIGPFTCRSRDEIVVSMQVKTNDTLRNCEAQLLVRFDGTELILHATSLANKGSNFTLTPGIHNLKFAFTFPVKPGRYDVEMVLYSSRRLVDHWASTTKLQVLDNFESHLTSATLNIHTDFMTEELVAEDLFDIK